jgi:hypothetical protein
MRLNILVPLAGNRAFKINEGSSFPKILNEINGKLLLERACAPLLDLPYDKNFLTVVPKQHVKQFNLDKVLSSLSQNIHVIKIEGDTLGATCTSLLAIDKLLLDEPLIITSFEQVLDLDLHPYIEQFFAQSADCGVLTFDSIHPRFSYVLTDENGNILEAAEKRPISRNAVAGLYFFKTAGQFIEAAKSTILNSAVDSGYYLSSTINELILSGKIVKACQIDSERFFHFHDSHNLEQYEASLGTHALTTSIFTKTKMYIEAFSSRNIDLVSRFFAKDFHLTDPAVSLVGKENVVRYISEIFDSCTNLSFKEKNIFVDGKHSVIEFELTIDNKLLNGTDVITWNNQNKMVSMNAYLYEVMK